MGILTDFFVANEQQLGAVFTGWLRVADKPIEREVKNPFTGQMQTSREWPPLGPIGEGELADIPNIKRLPHAEWKGIDPVKLASLNEILTGTPSRDSLDVMMRPALVHPHTDETSVHEFPSELTSALCHLEDSALERTAAQWQQTEEMQMDHMTVDLCGEILQSLRVLAKQIGVHERLYLQWSL